MQLINPGGRGENLVIEMNVFEAINLWRDMCTALFSIEDRIKTEEPGERLDELKERAVIVRAKCVMIDNWRIAHEKCVDEEIAEENAARKVRA